MHAFCRSIPLLSVLILLGFGAFGGDIEGGKRLQPWISQPNAPHTVGAGGFFCPRTIFQGCIFELRSHRIDAICGTIGDVTDEYFGSTADESSLDRPFKTGSLVAVVFSVLCLFSFRFHDRL